MTPGIVQHNIPAMNAYMNYSSNVKALAGNLQKLSSAYRINSAADDAAGLAISEKMRAQITGLEVAQKNAKDGISLVQTAEGALTEVHSMLNRMVTLAEQSANGTYADDLDREQLQKEIDSLSTEINRIANSSNFNGIKLLDGSLGSKAVESIDIIDDVSSVDYSDGIAVSDDKGLGAQSKFEISLDQAFSAGDKLTLYFNVPQANGGYLSQTLELTATGENADTIGATGTTNGTANFKGVSIEQQLKSIKATLEGDGTAKLSGNTTSGAISGTLSSLFGASGAYTVKIDNDANKLIIEANDEAATSKLSLSDVVVSDTAPTLTRDTTNSKTGVDGSNSGTNKYGDIQRLIGGGNVQAGDKLKFEFTLAGGTTASATVEITEDMISDVQDSGQALTTQIVEKLKNTRFDDNETTRGVDESQYKVSDFFDVEANKKANNATTADEIGSIAIIANSDTLDNAAAATDFKFTGAQLAQGENSFSPVQSFSGTSVTQSTTAATTPDSSDSQDIDVYGLSDNLAVGDKITIKGKLVDGRDFSVTLTGGTDINAAKNTFKVGDSATLTVGNIATALNDPGVKVTVGSGENAVEMSAGEIFGATKMFTVAGSGTDLTITNNNNGAGGTKGITGKINSVMLNTGTAEASGQQLVDGVDQEGAQIKLTFNKEDLEYGTAVTIGSGANAKTFELVASDDAAVTSDGNVRVVVEDLADADETKIVDAFRDAINAQLVKSDYDDETNDIKVAAGQNVAYSDWAVGIGAAKAGDKRVNNAGTYEDQDNTSTALTAANYGASGRTSLLAQVNGNTITLETRNIGKDVKAIGARMTYGVSGGIGLDMVADENGDLKLKAGDTVKINGDTYQFDTTTRNLQGNNKLIKLDSGDFNDKEAVAKAIKLAVEEEDPSVTVRINDDNSVTLTAAYYNGKYTTPTAEKDVTGNGGLTLQIGDTSDDFNRMTVSINDMHTDAMGLGDISVRTQEDAAAAIDKIKSAINYVSDVRGTLGATQNRLDHTINNLSVMQTNIQDAESAIRDTDVAAMMMEYTKNNIKVQAAQAMLAQANQLPQGVLQMMG